MPTHKLAVSISTDARLTCGVSTFAIAVRITGNKLPFEQATVGPGSLPLSILDSLCPFALIASAVAINVDAVTMHLVDLEVSQIAVTIRPNVGAESLENALLVVAFKSITIGKQGNALSIPQAVFPLTFILFAIGTDPSSFSMGFAAL